MITIKTIDDNNAEINIPKGTKHTTILLGIEMLIEALMEQSSANLKAEYDANYETELESIRNNKAFQKVGKGKGKGKSGKGIIYY